MAYGADAYRQVLQLIDEWETFIYHPQLRETVGALAPAQQQLIPVIPARISYHDDVFIWLIREIILPGQTVDNTALLQLLMQQLVSTAKEEIAPRLLYVLQKIPTAAVKAPVLLQQTAATLATQYLPEITALQKRLLTEQQEGERHKQGEKRDREDSAQRRRDDPVKDANGQQEQASARKSREQEDADEKTAGERTAEEIMNDKTSSIREKEKAAEERMRNEAAEREEGAAAKRSADKDAGFSSGKKASSSATDGETASPEPPAAGSVYYINNAGLILLHPYLSFFF